MMISDKLNWYNHVSYTGKTAPSSIVNVADKDESKETIVHKTLSENSSTDVSKSERNSTNEHLSQNNSADVSDNTIT